MDLGDPGPDDRCGLIDRWGRFNSERGGTFGIVHLKVQEGELELGTGRRKGFGSGRE